MTAHFDTTVVLDYEDQVEIVQQTLEEDIRHHLDDEQVHLLEDTYRYNLVDCLLDAYAFYSTEDEYNELTEDIGAGYVRLRNRVVK
jgi:hypothetical protein